MRCAYASLRALDKAGRARRTLGWGHSRGQEARTDFLECGSSSRYDWWVMRDEGWHPRAERLVLVPIAKHGDFSLTIQWASQ